MKTKCALLAVVVLSGIVPLELGGATHLLNGIAVSLFAAEAPEPTASRQRAELLMASARQHIEAARFTEAAEAYTQALEILPGWQIEDAAEKDPWARVRARKTRADLWLKMRRFDKAREEYRASFDYPAGDMLELRSWIHTLVGDSYAAEEKWAEAEQAYQQAVNTGLFGDRRHDVPPKLENAKRLAQAQLLARPHVEIRAAMASANRVLVSTVSLPWSDQGPSLATVLERLDEAGRLGSDIVLLPMECVHTAGERIPGPLSTAIAAKAREHGMYVIGNIREIERDKTYVTSFLCGRDGELVGKYHKSHKMPDETMDLGDDLPVFETDLGLIALRIGSDRFFADIDHVYTAKGARMIFWSQEWEALEDEHLQDFPNAGRALDYNVFIACARYAPAWQNPLPNFYQQGARGGDPVGKAYVMGRNGMRIASTGIWGGVATAVIPRRDLTAAGRGANRHPAFKALTDPVTLPEEREWAKRKVRVTAIDLVGDGALSAMLDKAGQMRSDIVVTYEYVWIRGDQPDVPQQTRYAQGLLSMIREKAKTHGMYVLVCGVVDRLERNEAILYDREGEEVGRYFKMSKTHPEMIPGEEATVLETDFGRIGVRICADNPIVELDRTYGVKGVDILFDSTQDWGAGGVQRYLKNVSRVMDAQFFRVEATHMSSEVMHASHIVEPTGTIVAQSPYGSAGLVSAVLDLDGDRPQRYLREGTGPSVKIILAGNDLKRTVLAQRRPELYQVLAPEKKEKN